MKNSLPSIFMMLLQVLFFGACNSTGENTLICGEIEYIKSFPIETSLPATKPELTDLPGVVSINIVDSLIIANTRDKEYSKGLYSLSSGEKLLDFFKLGQGPKEFQMEPTFSNVSIDNDHIIAEYRYNINNKLFCIDLTESINFGSEVIIKSTTMSKIVADSRKFVVCQNGDTLCYNEDFINGGFKRFIKDKETFREISNPLRCTPNLLEYDHNNLASLITLVHEDSLVIEPMIRLNQILVYSLNDSTVGKTICVGNKLDDINVVEKKNRKNRTRQYGGVQLYQNYVVFLYHGINEKDYQQDEGVSELQFFDYNMRPILRLKLPVIAQSFSITPDGQLYAFNPLGETEKLYKWNIVDILP